MSFFGGSTSTLPMAGQPDMQARKEAVKASIREELAMQNAQELMNKSNEKCFLKCVTKPGSSLSSSEETCLSRCLTRYLEAFDIVSKTYVARLSRERSERVAQAPSS
ncbi:Tim10/DDP family zinc finger-domain-containing protein [Irpex rosettiformis]|uniref:Tim10/DDP family zinc finger-domain-containing protein n=1 Tax=Irpex rosettiformis TaxID=378272 RepID=A0ACB8TQ17_9APHY|nr:Tim10/DDP family zinc finger-domain-containing protein [Irpex rosettiformis]